MGSTGNSRSRARLRTLLIASGVAVAVIAAGTWALLPSGASNQAAQSAVQPPVADPPQRLPQRAGRGADRTPPAKPKAGKKATPAKPKPRPKPKKKAAYRVVDSGACQASYYWESQPTASGEQFDPSELTAAHKTLPMGSKVRVTNRGNGQSVIVRINDRGPYVGGRCLDLSKAAMVSVGGTGSGVIPVRYQVLAKA